MKLLFAFLLLICLLLQDRGWVCLSQEPGRLDGKLFFFPHTLMSPTLRNILYIALYKHYTRAGKIYFLQELFLSFCKWCIVLFKKQISKEKIKFLSVCF